MVYLTLSSPIVGDEAIGDFLQHAKLGADGQVDIYARRSLPGVKLKRLSGKPLGVTGGPNTQYFAIDRSSFEWGYVAETGRAGLIWRHAPDDLLAQLVVVRG
jgi:type VI secretion system protein ImpJ